VEELEPGGPALRPPGEAGQVLGRQRLAVEAAEELLDLPGAEAQVVGADLQQLAGDPQARGVEARLGARAGQHVQPGGRVADQLLQQPLGVAGGQLVQVVDDQQRAAAAEALQRRHRVLKGRPVARHPECRDQGGLQVSEQRGGVRLGRLRPVPGDRRVGGGRELRQRGRLARSGGADHQAEAVAPDEAERAVHPLADERDHRRRPDLGPDHRHPLTPRDPHRRALPEPVEAPPSAGQATRAQSPEM
jgi:hypothetical protein